MARTTTTDVSAPPPRLEPSAGAARQLASLPPEIIERVLLFASLPAIVSANATARLFRGAPGGRSPVEHALRERARARGHARALPASLPVGTWTWTDALMQREAILVLARSHAHAVATSGGAGIFFSAFVDAEGGLHTCGEVEVVGEDGEGMGWYHAPPAIGHTGDAVVVPARVASLSAVRVVAVAAGYAHLLALSDTGAVYGCGDNRSGQLGRGDTVTRWAFGQVRGLEAQLVVCIAAGADHSLALTAAGCAYSWGLNNCGQLGHGDNEERWEPTRIEALDGVRVGGLAAGYSHVLLLSASGDVYSCGYGNWGQLGHGDQPEQAQRTPRRIEALVGVRAVHVSAGKLHSLVVDAAGGVHSFGLGRFGQLGHGSDSSERVPRRLAALAGVRAVRACAGDDSSVVLGADGSVHAFGDNSCCQICPPVPEGESSALVFEAARVLDCALSETHALYVSEDGGAHACGGQSAALGLGASAAADESESDSEKSSDEPDGVGWPPKRIEQLPPLQLGSWSAS